MRRLQAITSTVTALALGSVASPAIVGASGCEADAATVAAHIFDMSDANGDDHLSPEEFADAGLERYGIPFADFDANGDGQASADEYFDLFDAHHPPTDAI